MINSVKRQAGWGVLRTRVIPVLARSGAATATSSSMPVAGNFSQHFPVILLAPVTECRGVVGGTW